VVQGSKPGGGEVSCTHSDWSWDLPSHLYNRTGSFPGVKQPGHGIYHPPPSSGKVEESSIINLLLLWALMACSRVDFTFLPFTYIIYRSLHVWSHIVSHIKIKQFWNYSTGYTSKYRIPLGARDFSLLQNIQNSSWAHPLISPLLLPSRCGQGETSPLPFTCYTSTTTHIVHVNFLNYAKSKVDGINNTSVNAGIMILQNWQLPYADLHGIIVSWAMNLQNVQNYFIGLFIILQVAY